MSSHEDKPGSGSQDDPSVAPTVYVAAIFTVAIVIALLGLTAYFGRVSSEEARAKVVEPSSEALAAMRAEQQAHLSEYRWIAPDSGVVAIPIDRAMELTAAEFAQRTVRTAPAAPAPSVSGE